MKLSGQEFKGSELTIQLAKEGSKPDAAANQKQKKPEKGESQGQGVKLFFIY